MFYKWSLLCELQERFVTYAAMFKITFVKEGGGQNFVFLSTANFATLTFLH